MSHIVYVLQAYVGRELVFERAYDTTAEVQDMGLSLAEERVESELTFNQDMEEISANNKRLEAIQEGNDER